jgi:glycine C-acetyltransferase
MDGDIAPLDKIINLAQKYKAMLFLDESHAAGFIGPTGRVIYTSYTYTYIYTYHYHYNYDNNCN